MAQPSACTAHHSVIDFDVLIAHVSDLHLRPQGVLYQGLVDSNTMFAAAVAFINDIRPQVDAVIVSGDIVDSGDAAEYYLARELLSALDAPIVMIPGNHDERNAYLSGLSDLGMAAPDAGAGPCHVDAADVGSVRIIGLDITVPGEHHGVVLAESAAWLDRKLAEQPERPTVVVVHQPPFRIGIPYLDEYRCYNEEALAAVFASHRQVVRLFCGHVHRFIATTFGGVLSVTAPSTTTAIALRLRPDAQPASYLEPPAMLLHHWQPDLGMQTHLLPIGAFPGPLPFA